MSNNIALFITFLLGLFIIIGVIITFFLKKKQKVLDFIFAFAFSLLSMLIILDLLPEAMEHLGLTRLYLFLLFTMLGLLIFKIIDDFIPEHDDHKMTKKEARKNIKHIGFLTTIALIIHNIVEGMAIYLATLNDLNLGIMMSIGVGLHNIPLGIIITSTLYMSDEKASKYILCIGSLFISSFLGGLIPYILNISTVNDTIIGSLLSLTLGMLLYIIIFELWPKILKTTNKKVTIIGLISGIILLLIGIFIG
mgnify:CR=1 FL=1